MHSCQRSVKAERPIRGAGSIWDRPLLPCRVNPCLALTGIVNDIQFRQGMYGNMGMLVVNRVYFIWYLGLHNCNGTFLTAYFVYSCMLLILWPWQWTAPQREKKNKKKWSERRSRVCWLLFPDCRAKKTDGKGPSIPVADLVSRKLDKLILLIWYYTGLRYSGDP